MPDEHQHKWTRSMHLDGCHFFEDHMACACGAAARTHTERDIEYDPYSMVWMDDEGRSEPCTRCDELRAGARPKHTVQIVLKDGTVERDTTEEITREEAA